MPNVAYQPRRALRAVGCMRLLGRAVDISVARVEATFQVVPRAAIAWAGAVSLVSAFFHNVGRR